MSNSLPSDRGSNIANELAKERNRAAAERTLMAWIRTCLSLIGFGVGIDQIVSAIYVSLDVKTNPTGLSQLLGLTFIALGTFAMVAASFEHQRMLKRIAQGNFTYASYPSLSLWVAIALGMIGLFAFVILVAKLLFS